MTLPGGPLSEAQLPRNVAALVDALAERGPTALDDLAAVLEALGLQMRHELIVNLPVRYPRHLHWSSDAVLAAGARPPARVRSADTGSDRPLWRSAEVATRVLPQHVLVIDIETEGLDPTIHRVTEIAAVTLDGRLVLDAHLKGGDEAALIEAFATIIGDMEVVAGHNVEAFDLWFLVERARILQVDLPLARIRSVDTIEFSVLAWPTLASRRLGEVCRHAGVELTNAHTALGDVTATRALLRTMIDAVDPNDPSWQLVGRCLEVAGSDLCCVLPELPLPGDLLPGLRPCADPLVEPAPTAATGGARAAVLRGLDVLSAQGGIRRRASQTRMANLVAEALDDGHHLAVEAPTGTGKTLAYLLGALGRGSTGPVIVATATKVLQDQIGREALRLDRLGLRSVPVRQIQGVSNYLCAREIADALRSEQHLPDELLAIAVALRALAVAPNGVWNDVSDRNLSGQSRDYQVMRSSLRTDSAQCERGLCEFSDVCPLMQRIKGVEDQPGVIVANHALLATWITAGTSAQAKHPAAVLAADDTSVVFDEAHELEDSLTTAWTLELSELDLRGLSRAMRGRQGVLRELRNMQADTGWGNAAHDDLIDAVRSLPDSIDCLSDAVRHYVEEFGRSGVAELTKGVATKRPEFRAFADQAREVRRDLLGLVQVLRSISADLTASEQSGPATSRVKRRLWGLTTTVDEWLGRLDSLSQLLDDHAVVHLLRVEQFDQVRAGTWTYQAVPIEIGPLFDQDVVQRLRSVVLTSATLRAGGSWDYLSQRLGIRLELGEENEVAGPTTFRAEALESPFDFAEQSLAIFTNHLPVPNPSTETEFVEELAADQVGFLSLSGGKALTLFAATGRMRAAAANVRAQSEALAERGVRLLVQHEVPMGPMVDEFKADPGTVAYGVRSLWQGFDAPGETLSYLFIEKPPYPHPHDPIIAARQKRVQDQGGDPFLDYIVPKTAILFAQGFGRLIRSETDRGAAIIYDRRMQSPSAANRVLIDSLPNPKILFAGDRDETWTEAISFVTGIAPDISTALALQVDEVGKLLEELRIRPGDDPAVKLQRAAVELFGLPGLRPEQLAVMLAFMAGRDALAVLPTGFGKSICFQLPALLCGDDRPTIVVSPLVALIKDQVDDLRGRRRLRPVQGITSATTGAMRTEILRDVAAGRIRLLYLSPERLVRDPILHRALAQQPLAGVVIDEAHCVSVWGHDFRPEFRQVPKAVNEFARAPRMGLTATATPEVAEDIIDSAALDDPFRVRLPADRANLSLSVQFCDDERHRARELLRIATHFAATPGIVYASKRSTCEELANLLRRAGFNARHYHAGLVAEQRESIQEQYLDGLTDIIVATKAFGMGINKPDIGWVVHYDLPESLDGYAQEAGRAAREASIQGHCALLYTKRDIGSRYFLVGRDQSAELEALCRRVMTTVERAPLRGADHVLAGDEWAEQLGVEQDELNRAVAWLERIGCLERGIDCSAAGMLTLGYSLPDSPVERERFRELSAALRLRHGVRRRLEFASPELAAFDSDELEDQLVQWTLARHVTFTSSQRLWRIRMTGRPLDGNRLQALLQKWSAWQRRRLGAMIEYATTSTCRRAQIATHFGDPAATCIELSRTPCDVCTTDPRPWAALSDVEVPDPEELIDLRVELLRCVDWANRFSGGSYGEGGLKRALLGDTSRNGQPLGAGLLRCPQLGALRHLRGGARRLDQELETAIVEGQVERSEATFEDRVYNTLVLTPIGRALLDTGRQSRGRA